MSRMSLSPTATRRLFTATEVLSMVQAGILADDEAVELIEGELIEVPPQGPPHANVIRQLGSRLTRLYAHYAVSQGAPIDAGPTSLPEPDVAVTSASAAELMQRHPRGDEVVLAIEVAVSSHALDRSKASIYARAAVPVYWLVDIPARRIEVHEEPQPDGRYRVVRVLAGNDTVTPPGTSAAWTVDELLP
jgi:Uma2 family endonuclease